MLAYVFLLFEVQYFQPFLKDSASTYRNMYVCLVRVLMSPMGCMRRLFAEEPLTDPSTEGLKLMEIFL